MVRTQAMRLGEAMGNKVLVVNNVNKVLVVNDVSKVLEEQCQQGAGGE
jgi:hypothetical protein